MMPSNKQWRNRLLASTLVLASVLVATVSIGVSPGAAATAAASSKTTCTSSTGASWDQNLTGACRFTGLADFDFAAVRDNNTGLVWEQAPFGTARVWVDATFNCVNKAVSPPATLGGTRGWRLPSVAELTSLIDPSLPAPFVPFGVFAVGLSSFWTATTNAADTTTAWFVNFSNGFAFTSVKSNAFAVWCVRGPMQESVY